MMSYVLVRHKVADFARWKQIYDGHLPSRQRAGLTEKHLLRNVDHRDEVVILFEAEDLRKAQAFIASSDLKEAMLKGGVLDKPEVFFLS